MALEFLPPVIAARLFAKVKYLEPMFGDVGQARTKARIWKTVDLFNSKPTSQQCLLKKTLHFNY